MRPDRSQNAGISDLRRHAPGRLLSPRLAGRVSHEPSANPLSLVNTYTYLVSSSYSPQFRDAMRAYARVHSDHRPVARRSRPGHLAGIRPECAPLAVAARSRLCTSRVEGHIRAARI